MAKFGIGQSVRRLEDPRLLTGGGRYTDDTRLEGAAARAYVLRSPHAHADIKRVDTAAARKAPGVLLVLTGDDVKKEGFGDVPCIVPLENRDGSPRGDTPRPMLAQGRVRHVGDPVAMVVAETLEQAKDALLEDRPLALEEKLRPFAANPTGVGLDVPPWLARLEHELHHLETSRSALASLAETLFQVPRLIMSFDELTSEKIGDDRKNPAPPGFNRSSPCCTVINYDTLLTYAAAVA